MLSLYIYIYTYIKAYTIWYMIWLYDMQNMIYAYIHLHYVTVVMSTVTIVNQLFLWLKMGWFHFFQRASKWWQIWTATIPRDLRGKWLSRIEMEGQLDLLYFRVSQSHAQIWFCNQSTSEFPVTSEFPIYFIVRLLSLHLLHPKIPTKCEDSGKTCDRCCNEVIGDGILKFMQLKVVKSGDIPFGYGEIAIENGHA